jgi:hypothetical protein
MGFKPTIPGFERAKTFHASDNAATVIGTRNKFDGENMELETLANIQTFPATLI